MADPSGNLTGLGDVKEILSKVYSNFAVSIIILLAGFIIGKLVGRLVQKILKEVELNKLLKRTTGIRFAMDEILASFASYIIYIIAIIMALDQLGLADPVINIILIAIILIVIASIILGLRDLFPNIIAGIFISQKRQISKGDKVRIGDVEGNIIEINMLETRIVTKKGDIIYMPNSLLTKKEVVKLKSGGKQTPP